MNPETQTVDPASMCAAARDALIAELFEVNEAIFEGVDRATFERYVFAPHAQRNRIQVVRDRSRAVGYTSLQVYDCAPDGGPIVVRSVAGMLPAYRRRTLFGWFMAREMIRLRLAHPTRAIYGFACPVHPSTYRMLTRYAVDVWPHPGRAIPPALHATLRDLADRFGLTPEPDHPDACHVGWQTIQGAGETNTWARSAHPAARFFVERNPRYREGYGLLVLVPLKIARVPQACAKLAWKRLRSKRAPRRAPALGRRSS